MVYKSENGRVASTEKKQHQYTMFKLQTLPQDQRKENIEYWNPKSAGQANKIGLGHKKDILFYDHRLEWDCFILFGD